MRHGSACRWLWFDVGIKRYTTLLREEWRLYLLWFDVGIKRYTMRSMLQ